MFFLGIAGPLMPYFLMMGILIVFTLEVRMEKLCKPEKGHIDHHIRILARETEPASLPGCYPFHTRIDQPHQKDTDESAFPCYPYFPSPDIKNEEKIICTNDFFRTAEYTEHYFGLSPPCMVV